MDFVTGALPNVMFLVGMIAIGLGLGVQFKMIAVEAQLSKSARVGAFGVGAVLIIASVALYIRPTTSTVTAAPETSQSVIHAPISTPATSAPAATVVPPATSVPLVRVPDLTGQRVEDVNGQLSAQGLQLGGAQASCAALGAKQTGKGKKNTIICQSPAAGSQVTAGTSITYVLAGKD